MFELSFHEKDYLKAEFAPALRSAMDAGGQGWHDELRIYPRQQAPAKGRKPYKRTGTLGNTATHEVVSPTVTNLIGVFYGKYVLEGTSKWAGWPKKLDAIKKRVEQRFKAAFLLAMGK